MPRKKKMICQLAKVCNTPVCLKRFPHDENALCSTACTRLNVPRRCLRDEHGKTNDHGFYIQRAFCVPYQLWKHKMKPHVHIITGDMPMHDLFKKIPADPQRSPESEPTDSISLGRLHRLSEAVEEAYIGSDDPFDIDPQER